MVDASRLWERLVRAALRIGIDGYGRPAGNVPSSLSNSREIDLILRAADEIEDEDIIISRILCDHAYTLAQNLDLNSEGRGELQFKTGLTAVITQKVAHGGYAPIDRSQDITRLRGFYKLYREKNDLDKLREEEMQLRESGTFTGNFQELAHKTAKRKKVFATLKVLGSVLEQLYKEASSQGLMPEELKEVIESDAAMAQDLIYLNYNGAEYRIYLLENRIDNQGTHIAQLEKENLILKERLRLMEMRLQCVERQSIYEGNNPDAKIKESEKAIEAHIEANIEAHQPATDE